MAPSTTDLRTLTSGRSAPAGAPALPIAPSTVPRPASRWRTRVLVPAFIAAATAGVLAYAARDAFQTRTEVWVAPAIPNPVSAMPGDGDPGATDEPTSGPASVNAPGAVLVQAPGWIEPAPYPISVPALCEGVIREVLVLEGETVQPGQVVARMIDDDSKLLVKAAEATLEQRRSDVERARSALATAEVQVRVEQATADELRDEVDRKRALVKTGGIGVGDFRRIELRLIGLETRVTAAERAADEARAELRQAEASVGSAQVAQEEALLRLSRTEIRAATGGVVLSRLVEPGTRINVDSKSGESMANVGTVLRLYDPAHMQVRVDVPLADAAKVGVGTPCTITSEVLPDATFHGRISRVVHEANIQRNTVQFKVSMEDPSPVLKPEMLARVKLHAQPTHRNGAPTSGAASGTGDGELTLLVPASAVAASSGEAGTVWVVDLTSGSPRARRRDVQTLASDDPGYTRIRTGLRLTDRVVLDPPTTLKDGAPLRVLGERAAASPAHP